MVGKYFSLSKAFFSFCICLLSAVSLLGQSVKVEAPSSVEVGQPFTIKFNVSNPKGTVSILAEPQASGLEKLYGPSTSQSSSVTIINGKVSSTSSYVITFTYVASKEGRASLSGAKLSIDGKEQTTSSVTLTVKPATDAGSTSSATSRRGGRASSATPSFSQRAIISQKSVYEQEPLLVTHKLLGSVPYRITRLEPASYEGFVSQDVRGNSDIYMQQETIEGREWLSSIVGQEVLYPQQAGSLKISPFTSTVAYTVPDPDDFFFSATAERKISSKEHTIEVKPLPEEGKPENFSGAVGEQFTISYELSSTSWKTNEAVSLKLIIEGKGNLKVTKTPEVVLPEGLDIYDPIESTEQVYRDGAMHATRTIEYSIIPRQTGKITLPNISFSYFDPRRAVYQQSSTGAKTIQIAQGKSLSATASDVQNFYQELDEHTPYGWQTKMPQLSRSWGWSYVLLYPLLAILAYGLYLYLRRREAFRADTTNYNASRAGRVALRQLRKAKTLLDKGERDALYEELLHALWTYLGHKLKLPLSELSRSNISLKLSELGIPQETCQGLTETIDAIDFARFAPSADEHQPAELFARVAKMIEGIESHKQS